MVTINKPFAVEDFGVFADLPENAAKLLEFIGGEIVEVPSNPYSSEIAGHFLFWIKLFLRENKIAGHVTGEAGGYQVSGERYVPDVAYISHARQAELAVEIVSPTDDLNQLMIKIANYLAAGTVIWVAYPAQKRIVVYTPNQPVQIVGEDGVLDGGALLPGFRLAVKDVFVSA